MEIEQFELAEKNQLLAFLRTAYAGNSRQGDERFWDWHFLENPHIEPDNLPIWIVRNGADIVGQLAALPVRLKVENTEKKAIWLLDFIVDADYRGQGLGKRLVQAAEDFCPLGLIAGTDEQHTPTLLKKSGWSFVKKIPRYNKILFPGEALAEVSRIYPLRRLANFCFAPLRPTFLKNFFVENKHLRIINEVDSAFDVLWNESAAQWSCGVVRDAAMLDWQYRRQPDKIFDILGYFENETLLGYVVLYFRKKDSHGALPKAAITDICYHPGKPVQVIDALLKGALQIALEKRAGTIVTDVIDSLVEQRLKHFKFQEIKNPLILMAKSPAQTEILYDADRWFWTRGDSDISIFEDPNL